MPSEKFMKLKDRKKRIVFEAIETVLSTKSIDETSIIEIANEAGISRGTFYNYFDNKKDAINAYSDYYVNMFIDNFKKNFEEKNGDIFQATKDIYLTIRDVFKNQLYRIVLKNINYFNCCMGIINAEQAVDSKMLNLVKYLYEKIDKDKAKVENLDDMIVLSQLLFATVISALIRYSVEGIDETMITNCFLKKINIIEKGVRG